MLSKSQIKLITSLARKKYRDQYGLFVAEGPKVISELLDSGIKPHSIFSVGSEVFSAETVSVTAAELKKISFLKTPNTALAIFYQPEAIEPNNSGLIIALDSVRDPGNLGTIIRLCDWFGVKQLICSLDTADSYNPKVIQATMGSIARVDVIYTNLAEFLQKTDLPIYGACMDGDNIYSGSLTEDGIIVMGNEGNGISEEIEKLLQHKITIPQFGERKETESLNVATATAILLSEFRRTTER